MRPFSVLLLLACAVAVAVHATAEDYPSRTWTNDEGKSITAKLIRVSGATAILDQDGTIIRAPINRLSDDDKQWIKQVRELNRWREWTMVDGTTRRAMLQEVDGDEITLKDKDLNEEVELKLEGLSDTDRALLADVYGVESSSRARLGGTRDGGSFGADLGDSGGGPTINTQGTGQTHDWTDTRGKTITAEFRGTEGRNVVLFFKDREWRVPLSNFSVSDQQWVTEQQSSHEVPNRGGYAPASRPQIATDGQPSIAGESVGGTHNPSPSEALAQSEEPASQEQPAPVKPETEAERLARIQRMLEGDQAALKPQPQQPVAHAPATSPPRSHDTAISDQFASHSSGYEPPQSSGYQPPQMSTPTYPTSTSTPSPAPEMVWVNQYECFSCGHKWESQREYGAGDKCPHCGVQFDYMEDDKGNIVEETSNSKARRYGGWIKLIFFAVLALGGMLAKASR